MTTDIEKVLNFEYSNWDLGKCTIRKYLVTLARTCWEEEEGFSGKRPFGNSGWTWDVMGALVSGGFIDGRIDLDGFLDDCDEVAGKALIKKCFDYLESEKC